MESKEWRKDRRAGNKRGRKRRRNEMVDECQGREGKE